MELAVHLRAPAQAAALDQVPRLLRAWAGRGEMPGSSGRGQPPVARIYCGDEFCAHRLPSVSELEAFFRVAEERDLGLSLLTPTLSDAGLEQASRLWERLAQWNPENEVVVNDWGSLLFLQERFPGFRVAAGRLLNKAFKDPRLKEPETVRSLSAEGKALLDECTFDGKWFQEKAAGWGICRLEQDLLPYASGLGKKKKKGFALSIYFPYGYVTAGRICWLAVFEGSSREAFVPLPKCGRSCSHTGVSLEHGGFVFPIVQSGNAVFYRYSSSMVASLVRSAARREVRLVFQGLVL